MNIDLTPIGRPSAFSAACAQPGETLFDPVLFDGGSMIIAGGPRRLGIFYTRGGKPLWELPCKTEHGIAGFCLFEGTIYVQDGPVLSAWHGLEQKMFAARNLSTGVTWDGEDTPLSEDFYDYSKDDADAATQLLAVHNRHSWATLLADLSPLRDERAITLARDIRQSFGFSGQDASLVKAGADAALDQVKKSAAKIVFSAPVSRQHRRAGSSGNIIFTLGMNGTLYALDSRLRQVARVTRGADLPLRPQLAIGEPPADNGAHLCRLYYMTVSGGITVLDGISSDLGQLAGWTGSPPPDLNKVLPLQYHDGVLMGGGMLGADFFTADIRHPGQLTYTVAAPDQRGWTSYHPDTRSQLVVLSNGNASRLFAYGANVLARDRWGLRQSAAPVRLAITAVPPEAGPALWMIETEVGASGGAQPRWRALFVNTVDTPQPNPMYRPSQVELASGTLNAHTVGKPVSYGWIRNRPLVNETDIFCVIRAHAPKLLKAGAGADGDAGAAYDLAALQQQLDRRARGGLLRAATGVEAPVGGEVHDALVNFDLKTHAVGLQAAAEAEHRRMSVLAQPTPSAIIQMTVEEIGIGINPRRQESKPVPLANTMLELEVQPGGEKFTVTTNAEGLFHVEHRHVGSTVSLTQDSISHIRSSRMAFRRTENFRCDAFKVSGGPPPTLKLSCTVYTNKP